MKKVSFIIPTQLESDRIYINIQKIIEFSSSFLDFEIILVINNSDKMVDVSKVDLKYTKVIYHKIGSAASARNRGAEMASSEIIIFIDDDIHPINNILWKEFLELIITSNGKSIYLPKWRYSDELISFCNKSTLGRFILKCHYHEIEGYLNRELSDELIVKHNGIASYFFPINKTLFFSIGKYDESIPYAGFEDYILSKKINEIGIPIYIYNKYLLFHDEWGKIDIQKWLLAKERNAITRKYAIKLGYNELNIHYPLIKNILLRFLLFNEKFFVKVIDMFSSCKFLDFIFFKLLEWLLASKIYKGLKS